MSDGDPGPPEGRADITWVDMTRYADLDPDHAVPGTLLAELRDVLLAHEVAPLPDVRWETVLGAAAGTGEPPGGEADGTLADHGGTHAGAGGPWWPEHPADGGAGHHAPPDTHDSTDQHFDGGHW